MNRWGNFFSFFPQHFPLACHGLPGLCNLSVSTSFCKADSIKITPVAERERVTGVSLILPIGFVPFVFSARVTALPATRTEEDKLSVPRPALLDLFEVMSKYISHSGMTDYVSSVCTCVFTLCSYKFDMQE